MTKNELKQRLENEHIRKDSYCLDGGLPNESFCLNKNNGKWEVYYSERGEKTNLRMFEEEGEACSFFYNLLTSTLRNMNLL